MTRWVDTICLKFVGDEWWEICVWAGVAVQLLKPPSTMPSSCMSTGWCPRYFNFLTNLFETLKCKVRGSTSICWLVAQIAVTAQVSWLLPGFLHEWQEPKNLSCLPLLSLVHQQETGSQVIAMKGTDTHYGLSKYLGPSHSYFKFLVFISIWKWTSVWKVSLSLSLFSFTLHSYNEIENLPSAGSFPNDYNGQSRVCLKLGARSVSWVSHVGAKAQEPSITTFSGC